MKKFITILFLFLSTNLYANDLKVNAFNLPDYVEGGFYFSTSSGIVFIWEYGNPDGEPTIKINNEIQKLKLKYRSDLNKSQFNVGDKIVLIFENKTYTAKLNLTISKICSRLEECDETSYNGIIEVSNNKKEKTTLVIDGYSIY